MLRIAAHHHPLHQTIGMPCKTGIDEARTITGLFSRLQH
jgi:hypothetical protein